MFIIRKRLFNQFASFWQRCNFCTVNQDEIKEVRVPVPWGHIAVKQWGNENLPVIICKHGFMDNAGVFDRIIPLLPRRFCYVALDAPGHGLSSHSSPGLFYYDEIYMLSLEYIRRHYGNQKVGLMGHSMGSAICLLYTHSLPKNVRFVIGSELIYYPYNPILSRIEHLGRRIDKIMGQENSKEYEPTRSYNVLLGGMVHSWGGSIDKAAGQILLKRGVQPVEGGYRLTRDLKCQNNQVLGQNTFNLINPISKPFDIKMCVIEASEGIRFATSELVRDTMKALARNYGLVDYHLLRGKHHIPLTKPHKVAPIITNFLDKYYP